MILGAHNSIAGGIHNAVAEAQSIGGEVMQIFCKNQRQWKAKDLTEEEIQTYKDAVEATGLKHVMVHDSYLINMGGPDDEKRARAQDAFLHEMQRCEALGVAFLNFHPGSHTHPSKPKRDDREVRFAALDRIAECVNNVHDELPGSVKFVIENAAGQGTNVGSNWEEVGYLADQLPQDRLGICVDTQHSFASGYDWSRYDEVWDEFEQFVGLKRLAAFHLNDSKTELGSRADRHECIGEGHIGPEFFATLVNDDRFRDIPGYLETPGGVDIWKKELELLRSFAA